MTLTISGQASSIKFACFDDSAGSCLNRPPTSIRPSRKVGFMGAVTLKNLSDLASVIESIVTVLALLVGGSWAYFKFVKERVYRPRFDIALETKRVMLDHQPALWCRLSVKNIGASEIRLLQQGTGLRLSESERPTDDYRPIVWTVRTVLTVFAEHAWIESGETIRHESLVSLPEADARALRLDARLVCEREPRNVSIYGLAVFPPDEAPGPQGKEGDDEREAVTPAGSRGCRRDRALGGRQAARG